MSGVTIHVNWVHRAAIADWIYEQDREDPRGRSTNLWPSDISADDFIWTDIAGATDALDELTPAIRDIVEKYGFVLRVDNDGTEHGSWAHAGGDHDSALHALAGSAFDLVRPFLAIAIRAADWLMHVPPGDIVEECTLTKHMAVTTIVARVHARYSDEIAETTVGMFPVVLTDVEQYAHELIVHMGITGRDTEYGDQ